MASTRCMERTRIEEASRLQGSRVGELPGGKGEQGEHRARSQHREWKAQGSASQGSPGEGS